MAPSNEDLVRQGYKAFGDGDMETLRSLFAADAVHSAPGNSPVSGDYKGIDDILGYYGKLYELTGGTFRAELKSVAAEGKDTIVATHRNSGERVGRKLDQDEQLTFTISDGKFERLEEKHSDPATYDAFWS